MELDKARTFIKENHRAVMATRHPDGSLQMTPVVVGLDGEGRAIVSTRATAYKVRNLRADPHLSLCVFTDRFFGAWIQIDGTAKIVTLPDALEPLVDYYKRTIGEHPDWEEYREAMVDEQRVLLRITLEDAGPDRKG